MQLRQLLTSIRYLHLGEKSTGNLQKMPIFSLSYSILLGGIWTGSLRVNPLFLRISLKVLGELFSPIVRSKNLNIYTTLSFSHLMK